MAQCLVKIVFSRCESGALGVLELRLDRRKVLVLLVDGNVIDHVVRRDHKAIAIKQGRKTDLLRLNAGDHALQQIVGKVHADDGKQRVVDIDRYGVGENARFVCVDLFPALADPRGRSCLDGGVPPIGVGFSGYGESGETVGGQHSAFVGLIEESGLAIGGGVEYGVDGYGVWQGGGVVDADLLDLGKIILQFAAAFAVQRAWVGEVFRHVVCQRFYRVFDIVKYGVQGACVFFAEKHHVVLGRFLQDRCRLQNADDADDGGRKNNAT